MDFLIEFIKALSSFSKNPLLTMAILALCVPIIIVYFALKFRNAPLKHFILFGGFGSFALIYCVLVVILFLEKF